MSAPTTRLEAFAQEVQRLESLNADLLEALTELRDYTLDILTGPAFSLVTWPEDFPDSNPVLRKAKATIAKATP